MSTGMPRTLIELFRESERVMVPFEEDVFFTYQNDEYAQEAMEQLWDINGYAKEDDGCWDDFVAELGNKDNDSDGYCYAPTKKGCRCRRFAIDGGFWCFFHIKNLPVDTYGYFINRVIDGRFS